MSAPWAQAVPLSRGSAPNASLRPLSSVRMRDGRWVMRTNRRARREKATRETLQKRIGEGSFVLSLPVPKRSLLSKIERGDDLAVALQARLLEVAEKPTTLGDHLQETAT